MSGFIRSLADKELRIRAGQAFSAAQQQSAGANPANCVLFNPGASTIKAIVTRILVTLSGQSGVNLFRATSDPGFGGSNTPQNRLFGSAVAAQCLHEGAVAVTPGVAGTVAQFALTGAAPFDVLGPDMLIMPAGSGLVLNMSTNAINIQWSIFWFEVPA